MSTVGQGELLELVYKYMDGFMGGMVTDTREVFTGRFEVDWRVGLGLGC